MSNLIPFRVKDKWGFCDESKRMIISPSFTNAFSFENGFAIVESNERKGLVNAEGTLVALFIYRKIQPFIEELARFTADDGLQGFLNTKGKEVIASNYKEADNFSEGLAGVSMEFFKGPYGFINKQGKVVIDYQFEKIGKFKNGLCPVSKNKLWGYIDLKGKIVIPYQFELACDFSENVARVKKNKLWGFIDLNGNQVLSFKYYWVSDFNEDVAIIDVEGKRGVISKKGEILVQCKYEVLAHSFSEGLAYAKRGNYWGFIDKQGREPIPFRYDLSGNFSDGFAKVGLNNLRGFINRSGDIVITPKFIDVEDFKNNIARVYIKNHNTIEEGYIDKKGEYYWRN